MTKRKKDTWTTRNDLQKTTQKTKDCRKQMLPFQVLDTSKIHCMFFVWNLYIKVHLLQAIILQIY